MKFELSILFVVLIFIQRMRISKAKNLLEAQNKEITKSKAKVKDLNFQYEKLIQKYEGDTNIN